MEGYSLLFTADFFKTNGHPSTSLSQLPFFQWDAQHFFQISQITSRSLEPVFKNIQKELEDKQLKNNAAIQSYISMLLIELERIYSKKMIKENRRPPGM
ncbi:MAG: hypothetical protein MI921_19280 [Cytophagales bacterium]|nr:hypothetical protein [Cytophagales bacterium]